MRALEHEQNPEILREMSILLRDALKTANARIAALEKLNPAQSDAFLNRELEDHYSRLKKKFFGFGREKVEANTAARPIGHIGRQVLIFGNGDHSESSPVDVKGPENPRETVPHDFVVEDLVEENKIRGLPMNAGADAWKKIKNLTEDTVEITVTERIYKKVVHKQAKYRLKDEYNTTGKEVIITAPGPVKVKPGMTYSVDFALSVVIDKYEYHLPLERQRRKMEAVGLTIDGKTLYDMCAAVAEHCTVILPGIRRDIQNDFCAVHLDESPWKILSDKTNGQMWVMSNRIGSYYQFEPTRSGKIAEEMMAGYDGAVVTDAYGGYNRLALSPDIRLGHCWAHARREFYERYDDYPTECGKVLGLIDRLFDTEHEAKSIEDIKELRRTKSRPLIDELRNYLYEIKVQFLPGEGISKAINYVLRHWKGLTHFLADATTPISNNDAERALRHVVMGRKNFLGSQTINGADTAAALYTVIESAKKSSVQPTEYLKYLITERWHKRELLTPQKYADQKLGKSTKVKWPSRSEWRIET